jgi:di- and tripeptidase
LRPFIDDQVRPQTASEVEDYQVLAKITGKPARSIASRWREPSLTVHSVYAAGGDSECGVPGFTEISWDTMFTSLRCSFRPSDSTVIPSRVRSQLSLRIVPDQDMESIVQALKDHLSAIFEGFHSPNHFEVQANFLGSGLYFKTLTLNRI